MNVRDVMTYSPETVDLLDSVQHAAQVMCRSVVGALPVLDADTLVGMITDRDIVTRSATHDEKPSETRVYEVMSPQAICCTPDETPREAAHRMIYNRVRRLVVVENEQVIGILSVDDLASVDQTRPLALELLRVLTRQRGVEIAGPLHP